MSELSLRPTNGVSFGYVHTVTAGDASDGEITFDFDVSYDLAAVIQVVDDSGIMVDMSDAVITYPAAGQVKLENGAATFSITEDNVVSIVAQRSS
jgi:hypothetical protein